MPYSCRIHVVFMLPQFRLCRIHVVFTHSGMETLYSRKHPPISSGQKCLKTRGELFVSGGIFSLRHLGQIWGFPKQGNGRALRAFFQTFVYFSFREIRHKNRFATVKCGSHAGVESLYILFFPPTFHVIRRKKARRAPTFLWGIVLAIIGKHQTA